MKVNPQFLAALWSLSVAMFLSESHAFVRTFLHYNCQLKIFKSFTPEGGRNV